MLKNLQEIMSGGAEHALHRLWSDQLTEPEAAAIQNRAAGDPKYREELDGLLAVFDSIEGLEGDRAIEEATRHYRRLLQERRVKWRLTLGMAAGLLLAIGAGLTYFAPWSGPDDSHLQKYFTRIGEQQTIELDDGSVVTLNTAGQLVVDYSDQARRILLERGEAYFEVVRDSERPFTVDMGVGSVTALGTAFNIRKHRERFQVAVIEGTVALHELAQEIPVSPPPLSASGQAVVISAPSAHLLEAGWVAELDVGRDVLTAFRPESMDRYEGWRSGVLAFYSEPLYRVIQELNRYSRKRILIEDVSIMELRVSTVIRVDEIDAALKGLEQVLPIEVRRHYDRIVITGSAENEDEARKVKP